MKKLIKYFALAGLGIAALFSCVFCLLDGFGTGLFLELIDPGLFPGRSIALQAASADALHLDDIDSAHHGLDLFLDRDAVKNLFVTDKVQNLGSCFGFDYGNLGTLGVPWGLLYDLIGQS